MSQELWKLGAAGLSAAYRAGEASPTTVIAELKHRIARLDLTLNAYVALAPDLDEQAAESAARIAAGKARSPLDGIPVALKDSLSMAGLPATWGSAAFAEDVRQTDEIPVAKLRAAGAILVGKTNCPEFALEGYTGNATFGVTGNPWNPDLTPGGSSGGSVAAVAAGLAVIGIGTDGGGSIRRPAGHTGLYGLKPGIGTVARGGGLPQILMDFEVIGPVARSVEDLRLAFDILAGPNRADPVSRASYPTPSAAKGLRILYVERFGDDPCDPAIRASVTAAADMLESLGHTIVRGALPLDLSAISAFWVRFGQVGLAHLRGLLPEVAQKAAPKYLAIADEGDTVPARALFAAIETVRRLRADISQVMGDWDLIMTPTAAAQPWSACKTFPEVIDGRQVGPRGHAIYTGWVNAAGHPAIALPAAPDANGLPIGYQLIGDLGSERMLLQLAADVEAMGPGWRWPGFALG
jgi:aspartyl-tRNA(Asn)/glutamyl-tRNA(Gln) amidotransferase subunit A